MADWRGMLAGAENERTLNRARSCLNRKIKYVLGSGGFDPTTSMGSKCDCSGYVAWAIGVPRELPPTSGKWLQTTTYWRGGGEVGEGLFDRVAGTPEPGDIFVYPDGPGEGHMGIITRVASGKPTRVVHCSNGNFKRFGDAVQETGTAVFTSNAKSRIMRVDYEALRQLFGVEKAVRGKRLIVARWMGGEGDNRYIYKYFPEARLLDDTFHMPPRVLAKWLGRTDPRVEPHSVRELLNAWKLPFILNLEHEKDEDDPRVYVFITPQDDPSEL